MRVRPRRLAAAAAVLGASAGLLLGGCGGGGPGEAGGPPAHQPYRELANRRIAALAPERVADLLAGRGAGYALAAELNHYPGPAHVLDLADKLHLGPAEKGAIELVRHEMRRDARRLGRELVSLEKELDAAFGSETITPAQVAGLTSRIARVEGALRAVHLNAHLRVKELLTPAQVAHYDVLRGYGPRRGGGHDHSSGG